MSDEPELTFEDALDRLEAVVGDLERGSPDLGMALEKFAEGVGLITRCRLLLDQSDQTVALLTGVDAEGNPIIAPLDPDEND